MKTLKKFIGLVFILILSGCDNEEKTINFNADNPEVDAYVQLLRSNKYVTGELPAFKYTDIPGLLKYRNDTTSITNFPINPISSFARGECKVGMIVLWTIESVRARSINSKYLIGRFPSQNPILAKRNSDAFEFVFDYTSQQIAAKAYYDWWFSDENYDKIKNIDPLGNTDYMWH